MSKEFFLKLDQDERVIREIKRHPIGLIAIALVAGLLIIVILFSMFMMIRYRARIGIEDFTPLVVLGAFISLLVICALAFVSFYVYQKNELVVTNENIIQILQFSIFNQQISQLNLTKIQDVTVDQKGVLATMFNYGTIEIETAGEAANFKFFYAPEPKLMAKTIIEAYEEHVKDTSGLNHSVRI